jgi:predicted permease
MNLLSSFWIDLRYAVRTLRKNPAFVAVAVLAVGLGIGVNTGIFTILNGVALKPLPLPGATRLVHIYQTFRGPNPRNVHGALSLFSVPEYDDYRDHGRTLSGLVAYGPFLAVTLAGPRPQELYGQFASCNYFDVLQQRPGLGRGFVAADCAAPGASAVIVLSHDLWRTTFGADLGIVGRAITLNRQPFTVAGVAPPGFRGTEAVVSTFWIPLTMQQALEPGRDIFGDANMSWLVLLGRVKEGVSLEEVRADLGTIAGRIDQLHPGRQTTLAIHTASLTSLPEVRSAVTGIGVVVLAAVGMVLLIACANVANLLLARAAGRRKEIAVRLSLGASRGRLVRQLLTESLLIALAGGALGSLVAFWSLGAIMPVLMGQLPRDAPPLALTVGPDLRVLGYSIVLTLLTGIAFGLAPALQASRPDLNAALKDDGGPITRSGSRGFLRQALVGGQVGACMVLLIGAGLLLRGLYLAHTLDPGFETRNTTVVSLDLGRQGYDDLRATAFMQRLMARLSALPGVDGVAQAGVTPLGDAHRGNQFSRPDQADKVSIEVNAVSPEYFSLLGIPITRGRTFTEAETAGGARVAIVTESTARRLWPGADPLGKTLREDYVGEADLEIVGVAKDAQVSHLGKSDDVYMYLPAAPKEHLRLQLLLHGMGGFASTAEAIRATVRELDPELLVRVTPLEDNLELWRAPSRIVAVLAAGLGALALLLASVGVYGVVSYAVSCRIREIGIRITLGATGPDVMRLILRQAMRPVMAGAILGMAGCAAVSRILSSLLFGLSAYDPVSFALVPSFLLSVALLASYLPARRAVKVDPMLALRYE